MAITQLTPMQEIDAYIEEQMKRKINALVYYFKYVGEQCLNAARQSQAYKDRTGNLRSSLGYVLAMDGKIIEQSTFEVVSNGAAGAKSGIQYAKEIIRQYPEGIVLVVVAGMQYAVHVAALKGDVLDSAELLADKLVPQILKQLGFAA